MKQMILLLLLCTVVQAASAQRMTRNYKNKTMPKVLMDLSRSTNRYKIAFIHNELEDYTVTKQFSGLTIPEAIRECIGFYPITMKSVGDSLLFVEAMLKTEGKLIGRLVDSKKRPVVYANITLLNVGDTAIVNGGVSNEDGGFVIPTTERQLRIRISCVGYETLVLNCETGNVGTITLQENTEHIDEVVVEGNLHITKQDKDIYIPNQRQRNAANGGIGLLDNLMIPQLDVNRISGNVKSWTGWDITFAIDERIVDKHEIDHIRPKDVLRVEYIDMPTGKFADKDLVVNFVMRHYNYGGYVEAKSRSQFLYVKGGNSILASLDHKKMSYTLLAGNGYANERGASSEKEEDLLTDKRFHKSTHSEYDHMKIWRNYGVLRARYRAEKLALTGEVGITQDRTPEYGYTEDLTYSGDITAKNTARNTTSKQNTTTYVKTAADWDITDRQRLFYNARFSFGRNSHDNTYLESNGYDITSHTKEKTFGVNGSIGYVNNFNQKNSLTLQIYEYYTHYDDQYRGTLPADRNTSESETIVWPTYTYKPNKKWMFNFRPLGFSVAYWKTQTNSETYFSSRGAITVKYRINKQNSLESAIYLGNSNPNAAIRSEVDQIVNRYEIIRGNPGLKKTIFSTIQLNYSLMLKNWRLMAHVKYERLGNNMVDTYTPEGERLVHSYGNDGSMHNLSMEIQQTLFLLNRNLQLKGGISLMRNILTAHEGSTLNYIACSLKALYHIGNFALSAYYQTPQTTLSNSFSKSAADYGISAVYGNKGVYAEIGARRMFLNDKSRRIYFDYTHYHFNKQVQRDAYGPWLYMRLSYSFDFGRKSSRQNIEAGSTDNSAILHK
ncbi:MAG: carboxypeptidase-like regulatory domain-containing protein [Prevotella sp.]|nr:carboxypeptidase-like regulatory domain-containing protein [Prevotella sp.]